MGKLYFKHAAKTYILSSSLVTGVLEKYFLIREIFSKLGDPVKSYSRKGLNADINIKIRKYPSASSTDILDHNRLSLGKEPEKS